MTAKNIVEQFTTIGQVIIRLELELAELEGRITNIKFVLNVLRERQHQEMLDRGAQQTSRENR